MSRLLADHYLHGKHGLTSSERQIELPSLFLMRAPSKRSPGVLEAPRGSFARDQILMHKLVINRQRVARPRAPPAHRWPHRAFVWQRAKIKVLLMPPLVAKGARARRNDEGWFKRRDATGGEGLQHFRAGGILRVDIPSSVVRDPACWTSCGPSSDSISSKWQPRPIFRLPFPPCRPR